MARYTHTRYTSSPIHREICRYAGRKRSSAHTQGTQDGYHTAIDMFERRLRVARKLSIFLCSLCVDYRAVAEKHFRPENAAKFSDLRSRSVLKVL